MSRSGLRRRRDALIAADEGVFMLPTVVHSYTGGSADPEADTFGYRAAGGPLKGKGGEFW
jgi:hypothetical protein